ncbi:hypothetical protein DFS34DRAFT_654723 [Phlyctochytrium arcticum]|nr:hypothetical protein DFS34DRAFT_654723 [Phlyctochytrium arcticum]
MTISDVAQLRKRLYQPQQPFVLTTAEYKEQWKLGNNFWVRDARNRSSKRTTPNLWTSSYTCRMHMARAKYSSKPRKEKDSVPIDRRITSGYIPVECKIKLQVIEDLDLDQVTIQIHPKFRKEHTYHEMGDVDDRKRCIEAQLLIDNEAAKPYLSQTIAQHLPELVAKEHSPSHLADLGSSLITSKAVWNAKRKNPDFMTNPEPTVLTPDIPQAADNLEAEGFIVKRFLAASRSNGDATEGFAFARQAELEILQDCSHLVLLDSTHKTNRWDWRLFTCMVRDKFGSWIPAGQFFLERENGKSVVACLSALRTMILECIGKAWIPSNILIDQSHVERLGICDSAPPSCGLTTRWGCTITGVRFGGGGRNTLLCGIPPGLCNPTPALHPTPHYTA